MAASYPGTVKTFSTKVPGEKIASSHINELQDEVVAVETQLIASKLATLSAAPAGRDGWIPVTGTWTYASPTTINVPSGAAAIYKVGQGVKLNNTGTKYFYIAGVEDTLLTITGGSDYALDSDVISAISYTNTPDTAIGFPRQFAYTPTGISASNVTLSGAFSVSGNRCWVSFLARFTGPITYTGAPTLPIPVGNVFANYFGSAMALTSSTGGYIDAGVGPTLGSLFVTVLSGATTFYIYSASGALFSATSPITWANNDGIRLEFSYPI